MESDNPGGIMAQKEIDRLRDTIERHEQHIADLRVQISTLQVIVETFDKRQDTHDRGHETGFSKTLAIVMAIIAFVGIVVAIVLPLIK